MTNRNSISAVEHKLYEAKFHFISRYNLEPNSIIMSKNIWEDFKQFVTVEDKAWIDKEYMELINTGIYRALNIEPPSIDNFNKLHGLNVILTEGPDSFIKVCLL